MRLGVARCAALGRHRQRLVDKADGCPWRVARPSVACAKITSLRSISPQGRNLCLGLELRVPKDSHVAPSATWTRQSGDQHSTRIAAHRAAAVTTPMCRRAVPTGAMRRCLGRASLASLCEHILALLLISLRNLGRPMLVWVTRKRVKILSSLLFNLSTLLFNLSDLHALK